MRHKRTDSQPAMAPRPMPPVSEIARPGNKISPKTPAEAPPVPAPSSVGNRVVSRPPSIAPLPLIAASPNVGSTPLRYASPAVPNEQRLVSAAAQPPEPLQSRLTEAAADQQQTDRPTYAEVHLDGAALGRWVTRYIERQVTRPQAGATGFDPRMTPNWAGAPIGN
jgi:hypothetical protein